MTNENLKVVLEETRDATFMCKLFLLEIQRNLPEMERRIRIVAQRLNGLANKLEAVDPD